MNAGVLAFGDSITNGGGELQWGVALQSWALWIARGLGLPFTGYAVDGARAGARRARAGAGVRAAHGARRTRATTSAACTSGVNDVRAPRLGRGAFAADHATAATFLAERCDRVLLVTLPERPRAPAARRRDRRPTRSILRVAADAGALVLDLRDFGARNLVMADHVHPTAFGQVWIAERALDVLAADGMDVRVRPSALISPGGRTRLQRAAGRLDLRLPARSRSWLGPRGRGSGAPSCSSRFGT